MPSIILAAHGRITTYYQQDIGRGFLHNGIDQGHSNGTAYDLQIMAPAAGVVTAVGRQGSYGYRIVIRHTDGCRTLLAHHDAQMVTVGQILTQAELIAVMGNSGTKYVHSHQELWSPGGLQLDPLKYLGSDTASTVPIAVRATPPIVPKDDAMTIYLKPTENSSPLPDGINRIWTGYRTIAGIEFADVWGVSGNGDARRLTAIQWRVLNALKEKGVIELNVVDLSGNALEQIVYAPEL
ncbi:M23 family metallopeptidase [Cryobacterium sp. Y11]|uniref:M23 family metallopeptidase n=1 Tax=Cryobacterium sp. Y11 TaxID=2045016 RepID=UPI000CE53A78|nr:M23 family metallopeptidase [Cryobacterium sp. Y11]